ncbi:MULTISPECIES: hypothetical protein [Pseudomonas chlororaphis group]|uniref:hypothetical protein n=1 Tax=Pseudomonas chlororaphis group TaxID=136842 RepID=UPI0020968AEE|nr:MULTISPECIES: hypothetical protein [Pseudomonas chlororaphis group]MCO7575325.1 hypothetical protein [Pseudomonas protegens]MCO7582572.1 hypothetical protein [Pseudomonas chlororaphis]MCO7599249.1 hypothetical protein [Pseudomonas chlororaphis]
MKKYTKNELKAQIIELSIDHHRTQLAVRRRRNELNDLYQCYFRLHGDPEPNHRGIRLDDPRYAGVIEYTNDACTALYKARQKRYSAKRRLDTAVRRLMILTGASFAVPDAPATKRPALTLVRRSTASGETLQ